MSQDELAILFERAVRATYTEASRLGYRPTYLLRMLDTQGGVAAAKHLLLDEKFATGLTKLWELGLLEISVEALVLKPEFSSLFTPQERATARKHLKELDFSPSWDSGV